MKVPFPVLLLLLTACGAAAPRPRHVVNMEEMRISARLGADGTYDTEVYDAEGLFDRGTYLVNSGQCEEGVVHYDRIADEFPTSRYLSPSLYNAGLCLQDVGQLEPAADHLERLLREAPGSPDIKHGSFLLTHALLELERFERLVAVADALLAREDLDPEERVEAMARRAQGLLGAARLEDAARQARRTLSYYRHRPDDAPIRDEFFAAAANFVLAETLSRRAAAITVPQAAIAEQREVLERRARLQLDAQREYFNTIRLTDAHWAAASGYRIGAMYDEFWQAIMEAPTPPSQDSLPPGTEGIYEEAYRLRLAQLLKPLLRHAIRYWELTLMMVERTGVRGEWAVRIRSDLERMRTRLLEQPEDRPSPPAGGAPEAPRQGNNREESRGDGA